MNSPEKYQWIRGAILVGVLYLLVGTVFPNPPASDQMQFIWRLAAWVISALAFGGHVWYGHFRLRNSPRRTALHASMAVAMGAFGLAVAANIHSMNVGTGNRQLLAQALVIWPMMTGAASFVVALAVAFVLDRIRPNDKPKTHIVPPNRSLPDKETSG